MSGNHGAPRIALLGIGGTIAMTGGGSAGVTPALDADRLRAALPSIEAIASVEAADVASMPSPHMGLDTLTSVRRAILDARARGCQGAVVSQGTDTIDESAFGLQLVHDWDCPVVVTGAMRHPAQPGADGPANLLDALRVAATPAHRGVLVVLNATIHAPEQVAKRHTTRPDAFVSAGGTLGGVIESRVFLEPGRSPPGLGAAAACQAPAPVALLTAAMGDDGRLLDGLPERGYRGLVIDAMGGGHLPPAMATRLAGLPDEFPVIIASRTGGGCTLRETYGYAGGEIDLARRGVIRAGRLTGLKARVAVSLLLGAGLEGPGIRAFFEAFGG